MSKRPAFQFYPGDWRKDPGVQALSFHDRGVWFEILCLMHESEQRGKLVLNGLPMPVDALARLLGLDNQSLNQTLTTLLTYGVSSIDTSTGAIVCRRMVRDEALSEIRRKCGELGGNPNLVNQIPKQKSTTQDIQIPTTQVNHSSTPSSSSSSSDLSIDLTRASEREWFREETVQAAWTGYIAMRAKSKKPLTAHALKIALTKLEEVGKGDPTLTARIIDESTLHNWPGFYPLREEKNGTHQIHTVQGRESFTERNARRLEEIERLKPAGMDDSEATGGLFPFGGQGNPD